MDSVTVNQENNKTKITGQKRKVSDTVFEYDGKNRCIICKVDMGECNPRQYCCKTYCENASDFMNESTDQ